MKEEAAILTEKGLDPRLVKFTSDVAAFGLKKIATEGSLPIHAIMLARTDDEKDSIMIMDADGYGGADRDLVIELIRFFAYDINADAVAIVAESWITPENINPERLEKDMATFGSVSELPYREEIIMVSLNWKVGGAMITYDMKRDESGNLIEIKLREASVSTDNDRESGRLAQTIYTDEDMNHPMFNDRIARMREILTPVLPEEDETAQKPSRKIH